MGILYAKNGRLVNSRREEGVRVRKFAHDALADKKNKSPHGLLQKCFLPIYFLSSERNSSILSSAVFIASTE